MVVDFLISRSFLCCLKYKEADPVFSHPWNRRTNERFFQSTQIVYAKVQYANPDLFMPQVVHTKSYLTWSQYIFLSSTHTSLNPPPLRKPGEKTLYRAPKGWGVRLSWTKGPSEFESVPAMKPFAIIIQVEVPAVGLLAGSCPPRSLSLV